MRILMLTPYLPYPLVSGGQIRTYNLLKNLTQKHEITLFSLIKEEKERQYIKYLRGYCTKIRVFKRPTTPFTFKNILRTGFSLYPFVVIRNLVPQVINEVKRELETTTYDLIHAETFYMMPNIPKTTIPIILVEQTIEYLGYQSYAQSSRRWFLKPFFLIDIAKIKYWEKRYWHTCSRLITMSANDKAFILDESPGVGQVSVVANGVDLEFFRATPKRLPTDPTILFVGTFNWLPNRQAVVYLVEKVWPLVKQKLPKAKLKIVGYRPTPEIQYYGSLPDVTVDGGVEDIRSAYAEAHVLAAPVNWGKGTRFKILEAMATHTPIVGTQLAVEGITGLKIGEHVLIGETPAAFAHQIVTILSNRDIQTHLANNAYDLVKLHYTWEAIATDLNQVYQTLGQKI